MKTVMISKRAYRQVLKFQVWVRTVVLALISSWFSMPSTLLAENWPQFRGPSHQGVSTEAAAPLTWSASESVAWKTEIPGQGWSSPIVWNDRVFVTTASDGGESCHVLSLDRSNGKILWDKMVFNQALRRKQGRNTYATPTPTTDGKRVYACFGDGSFAALDFDGKIAWTNREYKFFGEHGLGSSPILYDDLLIMARDGSSDGADPKLGWQKPWDQSYLVALDTKSGNEQWKGKRGLSRISHGAPSIWEHDGKTEVISEAGDVVQGFDPKTGERLWSSQVIGEGKVPSVVVGDNLAFTAGGWGGKESIKAFKLGGRGDLKETNLLWEQRKGMPKVPSMLYLKPYLYTINDGGIAQCLKGDTGEVVWHERINGNFSASPVAAAGRIYFLSDAGETTVIEAAPQFKELAKNSLGDKTQASIAISQGQLFIRTEKYLWCIGDEKRAAAGLMGSWNFDEPSGEEVKDGSGHAHHGKIIGALRVEGRIGGAIDCKQDALVEVPHSPDFDECREGITVAAWIYRRPDASWNMIASREVKDGPSEYFGLAVVKNRPLFSVDPDGRHYQNIKGDRDIPTEKWVHLAGTYENAEFKLYVNGQLVKSAPCSVPFHFHDQNPLIIGGNSNTQGKKWVDCFNGRIDEVRMYSRGLSEKELFELVNSAPGRP